ncbi:MAG: hypothetical protein AB1Z98_36875 [Nannocystaceae bacterium]
MAYQHQPLTEAELGPVAWKVVRPGAAAPLQGMVARGLAPLPPRDLLVALYQLWVTNVPGLSEQSAKTVEGLPLPILSGALRDPGLHPGVLDFIGRKLPRKVEVLELLVKHPGVADDTLVGVSRICPEPICDLISENQDRWLACPAIVESLYQNPSCRMSVAQRMIELAVREGLHLELPNIDEIKQAIASRASPHEDESDEEDDAEFRALSQQAIDGQEEAARQLRDAAPGQELEGNFDAELDGDADEDFSGLDEALADSAQQDADADAEAEADADGDGDPTTKVKGDRVSQIAKLAPMKKIRLALLGSAFERSVLIRDANKAVCMSAIKSPRVKENEVVAYCANRSLSHDIVRYISTRRDWTKLYQVKLNLVLNPKTPMSSAMTFLAHLHAHDVRKVAHSRNIPSALAAAAKRRMHKRR